MSSQGLSVCYQKYFQELLPPQQYNSWIKPLLFEIDGNKVILTAPNSFTLRIIQERFLSALSKQAYDYFGFPAEIELRLQKKRVVKLATPAEQLPTSSPISAIPTKVSKSASKLNPML